MPLPQNFYAFLGASVVGVVCAATLYFFEHIKQEKRRHGMAKDLARLDTELTILRQELNQYLALQKEKSSKNKKRRNRNGSLMSSSSSATIASEDYGSACGDSDDLEFYDVSDDDNDNDNDINEKADLDTILNEIDIILDEDNEKEIEIQLERLNILYIEYPNNPEILWRIGKGRHKLAKKTDNKDILLNHISEGIKACELGLNLKPELVDIHKWMAILIGERTEYVTIKEKIEEGLKFKKHVKRAIELRSDDPVLYHMLGRFLYEFAKLKWYERKVASLIGEIPQATYQDALDLFLKAEKYSKKNWKENLLYLSKCYIAIGNINEAIKWLKKADEAKTDNGLDEKVDNEVKELLEKYNRC